MKRIISGAILLGLLCQLASCGDSDNVNESDGSEITSAETTPTETTVDYTLPEAKDYGGRSFTILAADGRTELYEAEQDGETVNDAVWQREIETEDYLGIKLEYVYKASSWGDKATYMGAINSSILAGDDTYDIVTGPVIFFCDSMAEGYYENINDMDIDLTNPWWVDGIQSDIGINGKLYLLAGDFATTLYSTINVVYYNQTLADELKLDNLYDAVRDGSWTFEKLTEMMKGSEADLNGDGLLDYDDDRFALLTHGNPLRSVQTACGIDIFSKQGDIIEYNGLDERLVTICELLGETIKSGETMIHDGEYEENAAVFGDDRALFMLSALRITSALRDMTSDYGILPYPKFDAADEYRMDVPLSAVLWAVPITASDKQLVADFCEYFSYRSYELVVPAYYESTLKEKYSRDPDTVEMLDLIRQSTRFTCDTAFGYCFSVNPFLATETILRNDDNPASYIAKNENAWTSTLESLLASYQ